MFNENQTNFVRLRSIIAERTNPIVIWLGAGISLSAGMPSWKGLCDKLSSEIQEKINLMGDLHEKRRLSGIKNIIKSQGNLWKSFQLSKEALGETTYSGVIRHAFKEAARCDIPENYLKLFSIPISGIVTLNIDGIASRTYSQKFPGRKIIQFTGSQCGEFMYVLQGGNSFIVNLHGIVDDRSSWIFCQHDLDWLFRQDPYLDFVRTLLCSRTIVFVGIGIDDIAVGSHLERLKKNSINFGDHFWVTDRTDNSTVKWAEELGVSLIYYANQNHVEISEMVDSIINYLPKDDFAEPVLTSSSHRTFATMPSFTQLDSLPEEDVRILLNEQAKEILKKPDKQSYANFDAFCKKYDKYIYRSWYIGSESPNNILMGYEVKKQIAEGAFGQVFEAIDKNENKIALKLLKHDVRYKPEMLQSFRRGVRSMQILERHKVAGMVPYIDSSEIPAFNVMPFIEGPNLKEAVERGYCDDWATVLKISVDLCQIIRAAHQLPERVLHRDIRPANIMLDGYYEDPVNFKVVVLDFDLSWYQGSQEVSVVSSSTLNGFLAPEQLERMKGVTTRNAAVDSFGIGMTLYFLKSGKEPFSMEHRHKKWNETLYENIIRGKCEKWASIPIRFARLIDFATKDDQSLRWDCSQILGELKKLRQLEFNPMGVRSAELLADEIAYRTSIKLGLQKIYEWNSEKLIGNLCWQSGVSIDFIPDETKHCVKLDFRWTNTGTSAYKSVQKYLTTNCEQAISKLKRIGWKLTAKVDITRDLVGFTMEITVSEAIEKIDEICDGLKEVYSKFKFD